MTKSSKISVMLKRWREKKASLINHSVVLKDIYLEVGISAGYFLMLTLANLIALNGLIQNSTAVIIGAMLISPLMGPILSFGFAFTTGNQLIWRKSIKKIVISVILTVIVALIATYLSPLKDITGEILSRTRPNLYDLFIAFFAGTAGAIAICTKKNFMTIVPGVAIATAVIPPLSVTGFGIGIWNLKIAFGGFFLFFTNFVAIVLSTCIVFFLYGFSPKYLKEEDITNLKRRITALAAVLFIISIPLIYTIHQSVTEVRQRSEIQKVLQQEFNIEGRSHLDTFNYAEVQKDRLDIRPVINTVSYLKESEINLIEKNMKDYLKSDLRLNVEQILVHPGGLKDLVKVTPSLAPAIMLPKPPSEVLKSSRENVLSVIRECATKVDKVISPTKIADFSVAFNNKTSHISIILKMQKDSPLTAEETAWLKGLFATDLNAPVDISVETVPFVPLLVFEKGETALSQEMIKAISVMKDVYLKSPDIRISIKSYTGSSYAGGVRSRLAEQRANEGLRILEQDFKIPKSSITTKIQKSRKTGAPAVKIAVERIG